MRTADLDCDDSREISALALDEPEDRWLARLRRIGEPVPLGRLGAYELLAEIGRGAQGVVFRARQPNTNRAIALKRLAAGPFASPEMRTRFQREIEAVVTLNHPNIVTVHGVEIIDGLPVLVMEWVDGVPLDGYGPASDEATKRRRDEGRDSGLRTRDAGRTQHAGLDLQATLRLFIKIADAVHHAHQRGVIHRDLKPSNILVDAAGEPHVLDFGLAKFDHGSAAATELLTLTRDFLGTPAFAAPEQVQGAGHDVDVRTDVYALGVILFQTLTGQHPYRHDGTLAGLLDAIRAAEPGVPSAIRSELDHEIDAIVRKAIARDRGQRYQSMEAFAADMQRYLAGEPIEAKRDSAGYLWRKHLKRYRMAVAVAATFVMVVTAGLVVSVSLWRRADLDRQAAQTSARLAQREARKAMAVRDFLHEIFAAANPVHALGPNVTVLDALRAAEKKIDSGPLKDEPAVEADVRMSMASVYRELAMYDAAESHLRRALQLRTRATGDDARETAAVLDKLALVLAYQGRYSEAESVLQQAIATWRHEHGDHGEMVANGLNSLAAILIDAGRLGEAEPLLRDALAINRRLHGDADSRVAATLNNLGLVVYRERSDRAAAEAAFRESLATRRKLLGDTHLHVAESGSNLALLLMDTGDFDEAERLLRDGLAVWRKLLGAEHPYIAVGLSNLGRLLNMQSRAAEAEPVLREALAMHRNVLPADHPRVAASIRQLAGFLVEHGRAKEAEPLYRELIATGRASAAVSELLNDLRALAELLTAGHDFAAAEPLWQEAIWLAQECAARSPRPDRLTSQLLEQTAGMYEAWDKPEKAAEYRALAAPSP